MKTDKISKVLIALDYNPTAQKVAEVGYSIAKSMNAEVTLLHVITDPVFYSASGYSPIMGFSGYINMAPSQLDSVDGLRNASLQYLEKSKQHLGDSTTHTMVKEGDFADSILDAAREMQADIIVIGSHSQKWLENILIGSVTEKVLHNTSVPLLVVPTRKDS
jgi:nucleotide-binding universal stress UspA family protein